MHQYHARIAWHRNGAPFVDNRYSRAHEWIFDGGATVAASSSPLTVPLPYSVAANVDPEEALVAAASSCHMLWFLWLAAHQGFVVDRYVDEAVGEMTQTPAGRMAISRILLRPDIGFAGDRVPTVGEVRQLHHEAHERCFIANSLKSEIVVQEPDGGLASGGEGSAPDPIDSGNGASR